jgi:diguanylate cyclase (GGDEF)-like protein
MDEIKQRLLIVDDSKVIRVTARKILKDHFETVEAADGEEAWDILSGDEPVSLVVSDLTMPKLDGFGLLEKIRSSHLPHVRNLPVIIITGANDSEATMARASAAGATDFIGKPFDSVHLLARTQAHASSHDTANMLRQENTVLEDMSRVDQLTGLVNESTYMEHGYQQVSYAIRHNSNLSVYRIEIDNYSELYKQHGQEFTDTITRSVGEILTAAIRTEDTAARIGAARFSLLLPGMDKSGIRNLAERISNELSRRTFKAGESRHPVTLSIGVASPDIRRNTRFDELLEMADQHLSQAIASGGNQVIYEDTEAVPVPEIIEVTPPEPVMETAVEIASVPEPEAAAPQALNALSQGNLQVEEIELASPVFTHEPADIFSEPSPQQQTTERFKAADEPEPSTFAGPLPEIPDLDLPPNTEDLPDLSAAETALPLPTIPANDASPENAAVPALEAHTADKAISVPLAVQPQGDAANEASDTPANADRAESPGLDEQPLELRRGLFARMMSGLRSLFGRS